MSAMNPQEMMRILDSIARDRNVDRDLLIEDLETAMVSAARKFYNTLDTEEFTCSLDKLTGEMTLFRFGEPVDMPPAAFGRIAAQTFKQVMIQKFREDERDSLYADFSGRVGEIVTGTAQRYEGGSLVVTIERAEGFMPRSEQIPGEQFQPGDRIRCMILDVRDVGNQVKIVLSRGNPEFIRRLFEVEVPEVQERVIEIKAMAREAGHRTKVAVTSIDSKVDAVGACVGVRGSRIKNIVDELNGEKIDIVRWNESSQVLIQNALKPAEVAEISLCFELGRATVVVNEDQLSLAIGKRGQNVRLAARLTGWDVDILTPTEFNRGLETMAQTLESIEGVTDEMLDRLAALGIVSVFDVEEVGVEVIQVELEADEATAQRIVEASSLAAKEVAEQQAREKEEAAQRKAEEEEAARRLLQDGGLGEDVSPDIAAAAILGAGSMRDRPTVSTVDPDRLEAIAAMADANAEAILSGGEVTSDWPAAPSSKPDHAGEESAEDGDDESAVSEDHDIAEAALNDQMDSESVSTDSGVRDDEITTFPQTQREGSEQA
ncbi:MAG: transcription termination/antitermination protein NusA [Phycisphaeraceae bacterium]|nr:transcription termination/antitermination protein NusA [Phycisphaeraceae bacterium]